MEYSFITNSALLIRTFWIAGSAQSSSSPNPKTTNHHNVNNSHATPGLASNGKVRNGDKKKNNERVFVVRHQSPPPTQTDTTTATTTNNVVNDGEVAEGATDLLITETTVIPHLRPGTTIASTTTAVTPTVEPASLYIIKEATVAMNDDNEASVLTIPLPPPSFHHP
jgi:hypothetical protein